MLKVDELVKSDLNLLSLIVEHWYPATICINYYHYRKVIPKEIITINKLLIMDNKFIVRIGSSSIDLFGAHRKSTNAICSVKKK